MAYREARHITVPGLAAYLYAVSSLMGLCRASTPPVIEGGRQFCDRVYFEGKWEDFFYFTMAFINSRRHTASGKIRFIQKNGPGLAR